MTKRNHQPVTQPDSAQAKQVLQQERLRRIQACQSEINNVLQKHGCRLEVMVILRAGQVIPQIDILPNE